MNADIAARIIKADSNNFIYFNTILSLHSVVNHIILPHPKINNFYYTTAAVRVLMEATEQSV